MLDKLEFRELVGTSVNLELPRMPRAMPPCDFLLGMILAVYVGFSRLNHLQYLERLFRKDPQRQWLSPDQTSR